MAALFGYEIAAEAALRLRVEQQADGVSAVLLNGAQVLRAFEPLAEDAVSGELVRCVKLLVLRLFSELTGEQPQLPWGILTGVRPGKLAHKLLDSGVTAQELPEILASRYLLPREQGELLTQIALLAHDLVANGIYIVNGRFLGNARR